MDALFKHLIRSDNKLGISYPFCLLNVKIGLEHAKMELFIPTFDLKRNETFYHAFYCVGIKLE